MWVALGLSSGRSVILSPMKLPNGGDAIVDLVKLRDYCLNPSHIRGRHKARIFASALGLTQADADFVRERLLNAAKTEDAVESDSDDYGQRYIVDFTLVRGERQAHVRSAWIVLRGEHLPRLTSCYVLLN